MKHDKFTLYSPSELKECIAYWNWAQYVPLLKDYLYHISNEGKRSPLYGYNQKRIGMRRGLPDYHYPVGNKHWNGFWLEMKKRNLDESSLTPSQREWIEKLSHIHQYATVAFGWEDAAEKTMNYINNKV